MQQWTATGVEIRGDRGSYLQQSRNNLGCLYMWLSSACVLQGQTQWRCAQHKVWQNVHVAIVCLSVNSENSSPFHKLVYLFIRFSKQSFHAILSELIYTLFRQTHGKHPYDSLVCYGNWVRNISSQRKDGLYVVFTHTHKINTYETC